MLIGATERLVAGTAGRCDALSADDLVPLVTLALVACKLEVVHLHANVDSESCM